MILTTYSHGLRASEVCSLRLADLDLRNQAVKVERLKGSLSGVQPLHAHRGEPLLDEGHFRLWRIQLLRSRRRRCALCSGRQSSRAPERRNAGLHAVRADNCEERNGAAFASLTCYDDKRR